jgi:hypothetical protein
MNLNKFTKAELISKLNKNKKMDNINKSILKQIKIYLSQFWDLILTFKDILVKLTLISFFIQIFKRYKLFRRLWITLNTIVMGIFGISLFDNFGFEFIRNFGNEMKLITYSIVSSFTNTQFYQYLNNLFSEKEKEEIPSSKTTNENSSISGITKDTGEISEDNRRNSKIAEWLKPDVKEEIKEEIPEESLINSKYLILAGLLIGSILMWLYYDEAKAGGASLVEWVKSFWPGNDPDNDPVAEARLKEKWKRMTEKSKRVDESLFEKSRLIDEAKSKLIDEAKSKLKQDFISDPSSSHILSEPSIDKYFPEKSMTSPSLENLNEQARESWSRASSPTSSDSSTETIKPMTESKDSTPLMHEKLADSAFWRANWRQLLDQADRNKIEIIEKILSSKNVENKNSIETLSTNFMDLIASYNTNVKVIIDNIDIESEAKNVKATREICFQLRKWIIGNYTHIFGGTIATIDIGSLTEIPEYIDIKNLMKK